jgi:predicted DNA-binding protein (MmcQ/YjbR family)
MIDEIRQYCLSLPKVTVDIKWGHVLSFSVAGKLFLVISLDDLPLAASFKVSDEDFDEMSNRKGFVQAPYFAKNKWVKVLDIDSESLQDWKKYILNAYNLIKLKLTKKLQAEINEEFESKDK